MARKVWSYSLPPWVVLVNPMVDLSLCDDARKYGRKYGSKFFHCATMSIRYIGLGLFGGVLVRCEKGSV